jgi:putative nucleotidyltransferase with HDIG domain
MTLFPFACPHPPGWSVDWAALTHQFDWIRAMRDCPQDPIFHAEGCVWTHVGMVSTALAGLSEFRELPEKEREILFAAALLHDVAKPACTREEDGRITSRGHSVRGAIMARRILWEHGVDFAAREQVCALVRYHQLPFHLINRPDPHRMAFLASQTARCDLLTLLARADALGRECADKSELLTNIELFREVCREQDCLYGPRVFPSTHSRFLYFRTPGRDPSYHAHEDFRCDVIVMSGLPGSGKDTWIANHIPDLPHISLDTIRQETAAPPNRNQGRVVQTARERAREYLRAGQSFVWNATNVSREIRNQLVDLLAGYDARIRIVYVETSEDLLRTRNRSRLAIVPDTAMERILDRWEVPDPTEAQHVEWWVLH